MRALVGGIILAAGLWCYAFVPKLSGATDFWLTMLLATGVLAVYAVAVSPPRRQRELWRFRPAWVPLGLAAAGVLYLVFFLAHALATSLAGFAAGQVEAIYQLRADRNPWLLAAALLLWIGPAEEVFWRGFVQDRLASRLGRWGGLAAAVTLYAAVHLWSMNLMLILAAAVCGVFWGLMFLRWRNLWPVVISHATWDVLVFLVAPIGG